MYYADLQLQSHYSGGTSKSMTPEILVDISIKKGLNVIGTSDIQHKEWREELKSFIKEYGYLDELKVVYKEKEIFFVPQTEIEIKKTHYLVFLPSLEEVEEFENFLKGKFKTYEGRPVLDLNERELEYLIRKLNGLFGPAHAFTPYTGYYAHYDSIIANFDFLELGLSSDTFFASLIDELNKKKIPFISNSDAHSPYPHRIGREFNCFRGKYSFENLSKFKIEFNAGLNPKEGKYHMSACAKCKTRFYYEDAKKFNWKCPLCGKTIKKGVRDRILELAKLSEKSKEEIEELLEKKWKENNRPHYYHILPLTEILSYIRKKGVTTKTVLDEYNKIIEEFGSEIKLLLETPIEKIKNYDENLAEAIKLMREDKILYVPGGAGDYGRYFIPFSKEDYKKYEEELKKVIFKEEKKKSNISYWLKNNNHFASSK
ncbi:MAG TPA: phosphotransferase [Nautiliaceae bacterium]|nr:phosphotransferase [Nautiliaceae bacterium]